MFGIIRGLRRGVFVVAASGTREVFGRQLAESLAVRIIHGGVRVAGILIRERATILTRG